MDRFFSWRPMKAADLPALLVIADIVHPAYPEDPAVFAERLRLYSDGCLVLEQAGRAVGYVVSHPWIYGNPPKLNSLLGALPAGATTYYIHDIALLPDMRGTGAAAVAIEHLLAQAELLGFPSVSLIAVNDSRGFWERQGFQAVAVLGLAEGLSSYDTAATFMSRCHPPQATQPASHAPPAPERSG